MHLPLWQTVIGGLQHFDPQRRAGGHWRHLPSMQTWASEQHSFPQRSRPIAAQGTHCLRSGSQTKGGSQQRQPQSCCPRSQGLRHLPVSSLQQTSPFGQHLRPQRRWPGSHFFRQRPSTQSSLAAQQSRPQRRKRGGHFGSQEPATQSVLRPQQRVPQRVVPEGHFGRHFPPAHSSEG